MTDTKKYRVGLGVAGGIATYKAIEVLRLLQKSGCDVSVAMTEHATRFVQPLTFRALTDKYVLIDDYAPENPDPIAHINFSQTIDLLLIVPATANIIAKFANGIADDFLSSTYLAATAPVLIAPAMNTTMWEHAATRRNIAQLKADGVHFVEPIAGELACKTVGAGKLEDVENIVRQALEALTRNGAGKVRSPQFAVRSNDANETINSELRILDLKAERLLITVGGTREAIDPVRFISNHSSGKMGFAVADAARRRGAEVTVICGATTIEPPENVKVIRAISARQMHEAVMNEITDATVFIGAAAVADYRPKNIAIEKIKKTDETLNIELEKTADILADVSKNRYENLLVVGFAAETENVLKHARAKLERKNLDMIVANDVSRSGSGFNADTNAATILKRGGEIVEFGLGSKRDLADKILDEVIKLRNAPV